MYRQFSAAMVVSIGFSAFLALSLTPALCATLLKPAAIGESHARGFFGWLNSALERMTTRYGTATQWVIVRSSRFLLIYVSLIGGLSYALWRLPPGFVPVDDQGFFMVDLLVPSDASFNRTLDVVKVVEKQLAKTPGIDNVTFITGYSFYGQGAMTAQAFVTLRDWSERGRGESAQVLIDRSDSAFKKLRDAKVSALAPPPISNLGTTSGFSFRLQDRSQRGYEGLMAAKDQLLAAAARSSVLQNVVVEGLPPSSQVRLEIDREKAAAHGVTFADINTTLSAQLGSSYVNDFLNRPQASRRHPSGLIQPWAVGPSTDLQRATQQSSHGVIFIVCPRHLDNRTHAAYRLQWLSGSADHGRAAAGIHQWSGHRRDGAARKRTPAWLRV
jgi:multidrug efflux pump